MILEYQIRTFASICFIMVVCVNGVLMAQFPPKVNAPGSTAIHVDSNVIVSWADKCTVFRGWMDISSINRERVSHGEAEMALSKADGSVVSLGDSGVAILQFPFPIRNGNGPDFVVFENAFDDYFLELAKVKVSSDGINYFEFPSISLTDTTLEVGTFDSLETQLINNLAGKYRLFYGTPFDLNTLPESNLLDINRITHVMIMDVVGSINPNWGTRDSEGHLINDPFPTPFPNGGFDLDAVGVIHQLDRSSTRQFSQADLNIYPNPVKPNEELIIDADMTFLNKICEVQVVNALGTILSLNWSVKNGQISIMIPTALEGIYFIQIFTSTQIFSTQIKISGS